MHELSIADALMDQILEESQKNNFKKVVEVNIEAGELKQVVPDLMQEAYRSVAEGTIAEGSVLNIIEIKAEVICNICSKAFYPSLDDFRCPGCNEADVQVLKGDQLILKSIEGVN